MTSAVPSWTVGCQTGMLQRAQPAPKREVTQDGKVMALGKSPNRPENFTQGDGTRLGESSDWETNNS